MWVGDRAGEQRLLAWLALGVVGLIIAHVLWVGHPNEWIVRLGRRVDLDGEGNVASWFSSLLLALSALAAYGCCRLSHLRSERMTWWLVAATLLFMSCDEITGLHEDVGRMARQALAWPILKTAHFAAWVVVLAPVIVPWFLWLGWSLRRVLRGSRSAARWLLAGTAMFFSGAMGVELVFRLHPGVMNRFGPLEVLLEEVGAGVLDVGEEC